MKLDLEGVPVEEMPTEIVVTEDELTLIKDDHQGQVVLDFVQGYYTLDGIEAEKLIKGLTLAKKLNWFKNAVEEV